MAPIPKVSENVAWRRETYEGATAYEGGENVGMSRLEGYQAECLQKQNFKDQEDVESPQTFAPWLTFLPNVLSTKLSPWLAHGCLSPRMVAKHLNKGAIDNSQATDTLLFELMVRDFYRFNCLKYGEKLFGEGESHCTYFPPFVTTHCFTRPQFFFRWPRGSPSQVVQLIYREGDAELARKGTEPVER
jgi:deoxyribodipyrimidine photolyase|tara:strand:+ start:1194 stop:1757 length:564 start_codon:yes stop_codon:yes gene_type:complete